MCIAASFRGSQYDPSSMAAAWVLREHPGSFAKAKSRPVANSERCLIHAVPALHTTFDHANRMYFPDRLVLKVNPHKSLQPKLMKPKG